MPDYTVKVLSNSTYTREEVNKILADNDVWYQEALKENSLLKNCYYDLMLETGRINKDFWNKFKGVDADVKD